MDTIDNDSKHTSDQRAGTEVYLEYTKTEEGIIPTWRGYQWRPMKVVHDVVTKQIVSKSILRQKGTTNYNPHRDKQMKWTT